MSKLLPAEEVLTHPNPDSAVIWLHGLGASGDDFVPIVPHLGLPDSLKVKFVFPHAPQIPVTINQGFVMPAWYDIYELSLDRKIDTKQILASASAVHAWIDQLESEGIDSSKVLVAGFSQGGAVAYQAALGTSRPLAGLMTLSTYLATHSSLEYQQARSLPIQITHGTQDPVVPHVLGEQAKQLLTLEGFKPELHSYPAQHSVHPQQIKDLGAFITQCLS